MATPPDHSKSFAKYFTWLAWLIALVILFFFFQEMLEKQWNPNAQPQTQVSRYGKAQVQLKQNQYGHYVTSGTINDKAVVFLLDTGATQVSIPAHIAKQLALTPQAKGYVNTANGTVAVYQTQIDSLAIGGITLNNVSAHINPNMKTNEILLGMSALKKVEFSQQGQWLTLTVP